jgi:O-antigen ligase
MRVWGHTMRISSIPIDVPFWGASAFLALAIGVITAMGRYQILIALLILCLLLMTVARPTIGLCGVLALSFVSITFVFGASFQILGFPLEKFASALLAVTVAMVGRKRIRSGGSGLAAILLLVWAAYLVTRMLDAPRMKEALSFSVELLLLPALVLAFSQLSAYRERTFNLYIPLALLFQFGTLFAAPVLLGSRGLAAITESPTGTRAVGFVGSSVLGLTAGLLTASLLAEGVRSDEAAGTRRLRQAAIAAGILTIVLSASRTAAAALLVTAVCALVLRSGALHRKLAMLVGCSLATVTALASTPLGERVVAESDSRDLIAGTWLGRVRVWEAVWQLWTDSPLFGQGLGATRVFFGVDQILDTGAGNVHNEYLRVLAELGVVGLAVFVLLFVAILGQRQQIGMDLQLDRAPSGQVFPFLCYLLVVLFPENFFELVPQMVVPAGILLGLLAASDPDHARRQLSASLTSPNMQQATNYSVTIAGTNRLGSRDALRTGFSSPDHPS